MNNILEKINMRRILLFLEKIIVNELIYEPLDSVTECRFINILVEFFNRLGIEPFIETSLNYVSKFIDTHIEFLDHIIDIYLEKGDVSPSGFFYDTKICINYREKFDKVCDKIGVDFKIGDLEKETE